ncbi:hypothetical protein AB0K89_03285 [Streptomyces cinnamoneus]|uniref:hypothetical protein n=1 Tax=Streptomyces cinnamoneus TaxID=53446 RepID=UPI00341B5724
MTVRRRRPRRRLWPVLATAATGLILVLAAVFLMFVSVPAKRADARAFATASACLADEPARECRKAVDATVVKTEIRREGKTTHHWLVLTLKEQGGGERRVDMSGPSPVFGALAPGYEVSVTYWRNAIRFVDFRGARQFTADEPKEGYRTPLALALAMLPLGAACVWAAYWGAFRTNRNPARLPWQVTVALAAGVWLSLIGAAAPFMTETVATALLLFAAGATAVLLGALWRARVRRQQPADTVEVVPVVPAGEEVFPGTVKGDVPYADGGGYLVAGPGRLACTSDPDGRDGRTELPDTLVAVRARVPYWDDPKWETAEVAPRSPLGTVVVECRDSGRQVLIAVDGRHAAWVLGALAVRRPSGTATPAATPAASPANGA